ncbi:MAG: hypothetical protein BroJett004_08220 [Planctomycetota bacterium]|nr:MAG: hypothetical protein BroJett004_08220 [Planctomycetota bacterium]
MTAAAVVQPEPGGTGVPPVNSGGTGVPPVRAGATRRRKPPTVLEAIQDYRWSCVRRGDPACWLSLDYFSITSPSLLAALAALRAELDEIERLHREALSLSSAPPRSSPRPPRSPSSPEAPSC